VSRISRGGPDRPQCVDAAMEEKMMPLSRYRVPKIARHAASGHTNDYDLENQSRG
jgi:hypothetical protein